MIFFKKKTDKQIEEEIKRESKKFKKAEHTEKLQSQLKAIKQSQKHLKHERFKRKYGGLVEGLKTAEKETIKGLKFADKEYKKYQKSTKTKTGKKKKKRKTNINAFWGG